jgi:aspartate racemase
LAAEAWQARVDALILAIKSSADRANAAALWRDLIRDLEAAGADTLLLACTDLNAVSGTADTRMAVVDATGCLAEAVVRQWLQITRTESAPTTKTPRHQELE